MKIELKNVTKEFDKVEIIKNISLEFETGKIYGLYGRNGSGKSVLMKLICGFLIPTKGKVLINGKDFNAKNEYPDNLRAVIEKPSFFPELTGFENLKLLAKIQNKINDEEIIKALDLVNLIDEKDKKFLEEVYGDLCGLLSDIDILNSTDSSRVEFSEMSEKMKLK